MDKNLIREISTKSPCHIRPDGFGVTCKEYAKAQGISASTAQRILLELCGMGFLERKKMIRDGRKEVVYYKPKKKD